MFINSVLQRKQTGAEGLIYRVYRGWASTKFVWKEEFLELKKGPFQNSFFSPLLARFRQAARSVRWGHFSPRQTFCQGGVWVQFTTSSNRQSVGRSVRRWQHYESKHINWDASQALKSIFFLQFFQILFLFCWTISTHGKIKDQMKSVFLCSWSLTWVMSVNGTDVRVCESSKEKISKLRDSGTFRLCWLHCHWLTERGANY